MQGHCAGSNLFVQQMRQQAQDKVRGSHLSSLFNNCLLCFKTISFKKFHSVGGVQFLFLVKIDCWERLSEDGYVYCTVQSDTTSVLYASTKHVQKYQ